MGADLSRIRIDPLLDFAGVQLQQGKVVLDADFNEYVAIVDRRLRAAASDILGRSTVSSTTPDAFKISPTEGGFSIGKGRLYIDGLLAENHGAVSADPAKKLFDPLLAEPTFADPVAYTAQLPRPPALPEAGRHLVYLDVWEREVTHLERPELVEVAVGVETTSRGQTVWQVRVLDDDAGNADCASDNKDLAGWAELIAPSTGRLTTGTFDVPPEEDPCELPPTGGYRGLENQTYRVEIHDGGQAGAPGKGATFKWSRENASVGSRVASIVSASELELQSLGRDDVLRFNTGDWVEIIDDVRELSQRCGEMRQITVNEAARRVAFTAPLPVEMIPGAFPDSTFPRERNLRVRRWDQKHEVLHTGPGGSTSVFQDLDAGTTGVIGVPAAGVALLLENGVTVSFASTGAKGFKAGDFWVFAARTADASVEPLDNAPPRGIHHHYERLALWDVTANAATDCRHPWPPRGEGQDCSCTACVTAQSHASGQFTIQDAVNQVRESGGTVCLGPGQYALRETVRLVSARSVRIRGQGPATIVVGPGCAFALQSCIATAIENLAIVSLGRESAVIVRSALGLALRQLVVAVLATNDARGAAISLQGVVLAASISENVIIAPVGVLANDPTSQSPNDEQAAALFLVAAAIAIEDNLMSCQSQAIALNGNVLHMMDTRIAGNEVLGCRDVAISALGIGAPGSSTRISRNSVSVPGSAIRCGVDGLWIDGNKLFSPATADAARIATTVGIALATGLDKSGADQCQILSNQIGGFALAGIVIGSPTRDLIVKLNIIEKCGNGIVSVDDASAGSVSIENNHLRNIGTGKAAGGTGITAPVIGIGVARADAATIAGNTIRGLGVEMPQSVLRAGILTFGVLHPTVSGNDVNEVAPSGETVGTSAAIMLRAPYLQFEVVQNRVQRDAATFTRTNQAGSGSWFALAAVDSDPQNLSSRVGNFASVRIDNTRVLVLGHGRPYVAALGTTFSDTGAAAPVQTRGSILGNVFNARGSTPAVDVAASGECLFSDNRVEARGNTNIAVSVTTLAAIVNANRVRGGEVSIQVAGAKAAAVLGNITTGTIAIPGGLQPPWDALNLHV